MYNIQEDEGLVEIVKKCKYLYGLCLLFSWKSSPNPLFSKFSFLSPFFPFLLLKYKQQLFPLQRPS